MTDGGEVYSPRSKYAALPFWKCDTCGNYVGCHHKTDNPTRPLGVIATPELKNARQHIHRLIDPIWQNGHMSRNKLYDKIARKLEWKSYHTANIRTIDDARKVYMVGKEILESTRI